MPSVHLADRDEAFRCRLARALRQADVDVVEFANGSEVYAHTLEHPPDLVVLDTDLEEVDGFQVFQWLQSRRLPAASVVFLTEFAHPGVARACKERGARDFLAKGRAVDVVVERLLTILGERDPLTGRTLTGALAWLQSRGKSGRLEASACGQTGTILLHNGRVVSAEWDSWRGDDALRLLTEVHSASTFTFAEGLDEIVEPRPSGPDEASARQAAATELVAELDEAAEEADAGAAESLAPVESADDGPDEAEAPQPARLESEEREAPAVQEAAEVVERSDEDGTPFEVYVGPPAVISAATVDGQREEDLSVLRAPRILVARTAPRTVRRQATLPLVAAAAAFLLTAGLTATAFLDWPGTEAAVAEDDPPNDPDGGNAADAGVEARVPPPLSVANARAPQRSRSGGQQTAVTPRAPARTTGTREAPNRPLDPAVAQAAPPDRQTPEPRLARDAAGVSSEAPGEAALSRQVPPRLAADDVSSPASAAREPARPLSENAASMFAAAPNSLDAVRHDTPTATPRAALLHVAEAPAVPTPTPAELARQRVERQRELERIEREARATRLDARPVPKQALRFRYPPLLAEQKVGGAVELLVQVDPTGRVADVRVLSSSGSEALDAAAVEAVAGTSYEPPRRDGRPVSAWIRQPVVGMCCRTEAAP